MPHGETFHPHIPASSKVKEFSVRATLLGLLFGFFFAAANGYLALKIGQTVSASIPAAILSMAILRTCFKRVSILENNIVQTIATVGEGLAAGVVFTIPALIFLGDSPSIGRIFLLSLLGGVLGILFMIPLRRFLIVEEHKVLPFPEGTACAELLKAGEESKGSAWMAVWGVVVGGLYKICMNGLHLWRENATYAARFFQNTQLTADTTPALLGVGYIIGPRIAGYMFSGSILAWWVIIPLIKMFGQGLHVIYPSSMAVAQMSADDIWDNYIRYIGAGTIATGGLLSLAKVFPIVYRTIRVGTKELLNGFKARSHLVRTDKDIPLTWLILGSVAIILFLWLYPGFPMNFLTILLLVILGFFFTIVTCLAVGLVGSSSNPVSGMTITTLLITCVIFVLLGWTERVYLISAITMGIVTCNAICLAGTTAQDLKTGYLLGATPRSQQIAEILGTIIPSIALGYIIYLLNEAYHIGSPLMPAPQASLLAMVAEGVISGDLPYDLVGVGIVIGLLLWIVNVPVLPFALGVYLPLSLNTATMVGGLVRAYVNRRMSGKKAFQERGLLLASGLIGGDACIGIVIAALAITGLIPPTEGALTPDWVSFLLFGLLAVWLGKFALKKVG